MAIFNLNAGRENQKKINPHHQKLGEIRTSTGVISIMACNGMLN
ncbi:MAG TPA: hypothetical protein VK203_07485 [Nostocaceae cyanobacterium]|nr:hypothetical protein [Nostocaceae cyanobacterium]